MPCKPPHNPGTLLEPSWRTQFSEIKDHLNTGDIILVHGRYPGSWVIEKLQKSPYGHSAMVVKKSDLTLTPEQSARMPDLMLWESNVKMMRSAKDLWQYNAEKEGPMLVSLVDRLSYSQNNYEEVYIAWRPLFLDRSLVDFRQILPAYFTSVINCVFPTEREIIASVYLGRRYNRSAARAADIMGITIEKRGDQNIVHENFNPFAFRALGLKEGFDATKNTIYCSELLASTYKELNLLTKTHVSNAYSPGDFSESGSVRFLKQGWLGKEMLVDMCG